MKSSTIRRSNLSKEKMAVLEALAKYRDENGDITPSVYVRPNKEKELDVLWQNFKVTQKSDKSPSVFLITGFISGLLVAAIFAGLFFVATHDFHFKKSTPATKTEKVDLVPASATTEETTSNETYEVQSGDTMDAILTRFYGGYSEEKLNLILDANNLSDPNKLSIGQKLIIPVADN